MSEKRIWAISEDGKIEYISLTSDRLEEAIRVLRKCFFVHENVCKAVGLAAVPEAIKECDVMIKSTAQHGVSVIAIDKETGKIAGVLLNKIQDKNTSSKKFYQEYIKKAKYTETKRIFEFLVDIEDSIDPFTPYDADCLMELVFLGVMPEYSNRGIGYMLCSVSVELATLLHKGENVKISLDNSELPLEPRPQIVTVVGTSFKSQRIFRKLQFDLVKTISCDDLYHNGKPYSSILGNETKEFTVDCKRL